MIKHNTRSVLEEILKQKASTKPSAANLLVDACASNVQVGPLRTILLVLWLVKEALKEGCGRRGVSISALATVVQVRSCPLDAFSVLLHDRHSPERLTCCIASFFELLGHLVIIGEETSSLFTKSYHDGTSQGGDINHLLGIELLASVGDGVSQHKPAFSIRIAHLNSVAFE